MKKPTSTPENDEFHWALANRAEPFTRSYSAPLINASARFVTGKLWRLLHKITRDPTSASPIPRSNADLAQPIDHHSRLIGRMPNLDFHFAVERTNAWRISRNGLANKARSRQDQREQQKSLPFDCFAY